MKRFTKASDRASARCFKALFDAHATVYAGTDTLMPFVAPGAALVSEVRLFADVGITPEQALATATTTPGQFWADGPDHTIRMGVSRRVCRPTSCCIAAIPLFRSRRSMQSIR